MKEDDLTEEKELQQGILYGDDLTHSMWASQNGTSAQLALPNNEKGTA